MPAEQLDIFFPENKALRFFVQALCHIIDWAFGAELSALDHQQVLA